MKQFIEDYGFAIFEFILGILFIGYFAMLLSAFTSF